MISIFHFWFNCACSLNYNTNNQKTSALNWVGHGDHACNSSTVKMEEERPKVQDHPLLHRSSRLSRALWDLVTNTNGNTKETSKNKWIFPKCYISYDIRSLFFLDNCGHTDCRLFKLTWKRYIQNIIYQRQYWIV